MISPSRQRHNNTDHGQKRIQVEPVHGLDRVVLSPGSDERNMSSAGRPPSQQCVARIASHRIGPADAVCGVFPTLPQMSVLGKALTAHTWRENIESDEKTIVVSLIHPVAVLGSGLFFLLFREDSCQKIVVFFVVVAPPTSQAVDNRIIQNEDTLRCGPETVVRLVISFRVALAACHGRSHGPVTCHGNVVPVTQVDYHQLIPVS